METKLLHLFILLTVTSGALSSIQLQLSQTRPQQGIAVKQVAPQQSNTVKTAPQLSSAVKQLQQVKTLSTPKQVYVNPAPQYKPDVRKVAYSPYDMNYNTKESNQVVAQPYVGRCGKSSHSFWGRPKHYDGHFQHHRRYFGSFIYHFLLNHFNTGYTDTKIIELIKSLGKEESTEVLTQFMIAMTSEEAEIGLKYFGIKPDDAKKVLNQLKSGKADEIKKAREAIHKVMNSFSNEKLKTTCWFYIRYLARIYYIHLKREKAKEVIANDSLKKLIVGLTVLASVEERHNIRGIDFMPLVQKLKTLGEAARPEVVKILSDWIDKVDIRTLQTVGFIYATSTRNVVDDTTVAPPTTTTEKPTTTTEPPTTTTEPPTTTTEPPTTTTEPPTTTTQPPTTAVTTTPKPTTKPPVTGLP